IVLVTVPAGHAPEDQDRRVLDEEVAATLPGLAERQHGGCAVEVFHRDPAPLVPVASRDLPADSRDDASQLDLLVPVLLQVRRVDVLEDAHLLTELVQRVAADEEAQ